MLQKTKKIIQKPLFELYDSVWTIENNKVVNLIVCKVEHEINTFSETGARVVYGLITPLSGIEYYPHNDRSEDKVINRDEKFVHATKEDLLKSL